MIEEPLLRISSLTVRYSRSNPPREVLSSISATLNPGDCLVVVGPNGSGKSTLLHAIAGDLEAQATGDVVLGGRNLLREPQHRRAQRIALVHQDPSRGTAAHLSLREHCRLTVAGAERRQVVWSDVAARLEALGTDLDPGQLAGELSGGQRQLFTVLLAVLSAPTLLLVDEPTSALDARHQALVIGVIDEYVAKTRQTTIFVTHDVNESLRLGNRLLVLDARGQAMAFLGPTEKTALDERALRELLAKAAAAVWNGT